MMALVALVTIFGVVAIGVAMIRRRKTWLVDEDSVAITINRDGFIQRILPAGRHVLGLFERVDFTLETRTKLVAEKTTAVTTSDGIMITINWSGTYNLQPDLITDRLSQRLRGLVQADRPITRNVDICLRKLIGNYTLHDLFHPATRDRIERQLDQLLVDRLKPLGIVFNGLSLQVIDLPREVAEALNKASAIATLDVAIRQVDSTTREIIRGVYQLDEVLHWDAYLPTPSRLAMKQAQAMAS